MSQDFSNITGKILIASPYTMEGNVFHQSLIYVVQHDTDGAVGFIFNRLINSTPVSSLLRNVDPTLGLNLSNLEIHIGGPVEIERGFFLHSSEYDKNILFKTNNSNLVVSSNLGILQDINNGKGPNLNMFIIGYTAWTSGQMEFELQHNLWIVSEPDNDLIFGNDHNSKWFKALAKLGIDSRDFIPGFVANA